MNYKEIFEEFTDLVCYDQDDYLVNKTFELYLKQQKNILTQVYYYKGVFIFYKFHSDDSSGKFIFNHNVNDIQSYIENNFSEDDKNKLKKLKTLHLINEF